MLENNRVVTLDKNYIVLNVEYFPTAEAAYNYYNEMCALIYKNLKPGEEIKIARFRWDSVMHMDTITK